MDAPKKNIGKAPRTAQYLAVREIEGVNEAAAGEVVRNERYLVMAMGKNALLIRGMLQINLPTNNCQ